jgi:serine/threonine protein kinase/tetratricopeptide (TPR) repeat protein
VTAMSAAETVFFAALAKVDPAERAAYLNEACGADTDLRRQVDRLLAAHPQVGSFLQDDAANHPSPLRENGPDLRGDATLSAPVTERPGAVIGPYKLLQQIGEGGMGVVWMAEQTQPVQRKVALKVIKPGMDSRQVIARFEAERQALAMMDHVNIARVFDGGTTGEKDEGGRIKDEKDAGSDSSFRLHPSSFGRPYFVMELVHGVPITNYCDDNHLTPRERLELFVPVCQAIQHAHQKGIIHRDIKPSNVMVTLYDGKPVPKVIDFGVAKATEQKLTERTLFTQYGTMVGTLEYMSPEQAEMSARGVDTRSDIYSLGVLLYELLTGSTPLTHKRMKEAAYAEILRMIKEEEPPKPSTRLSDSGEALASISANRHTEPAKLTKLVKGELDWIVMKTLEKDRNRRYETAQDFAADVQRYLDDEQVQACPPSATYRLRKFARRNKAALITGSLMATALVIGTAVSLRQAIEADSARRLADQRWENEKRARKDAEEQSERAQASFDKAVKAVQQMLAEVGDVKVAAIPQMKAMRQRLLEDAVDFYTDLIALNPRDPQVYIRRADVNRLLDKLDQVLSDYLKAIELDPENAEAHAQLGDLLAFSPFLAVGSAREQAVYHARKAVALQPNEPRLHAALGWVYRQTGKTKDAVVEFKKAAELYPLGSAAAYHMRALAESTAGNHRGTLAILLEERERYPSDRLVHEYIGNAYVALGDDPLALAAYTKSVEQDTTKSLGRSRSLYNRGDIYLRQKKYALALADYSWSLALYPGHWHVYNQRALAHFHLGHFEQALADYEEALQLTKAKLGADHPATLSSMTSLTEAYALTGRLDKAEPLLREQADYWKKKAGADSAPYASQLAGLGLNLLGQTKYADAEPLLRECLSIRELKEPDGWTTFNTKSMLGGSLLGQKKYVAAEPLLAEGYEGMKQREAKMPAAGKARLTESLERLVQLCDAQGKPDEAARWRAELAARKAPPKDEKQPPGKVAPPDSDGKDSGR